MKGLQTKSIAGGLKDFDMRKRIVTGYLSETDTEDKVKDVIVAGSYAKTLSERKNDIFFLNQHNWEQPHGKFSVLQEDSKGLYFESEPLIDTTYSSDLLKLYEAGIVKEHSIGYSVVNSTRDSKGVRHITELKLYEGSNVTLGAHPNTPFMGMKNLSEKEINDQTKLILKAFRNGTFTDETFMLLEIALKQLQTQSFELGKKSLESKNEPSLDTPKLEIEPNEEQKKIFNEFLNNI